MKKLVFLFLISFKALSCEIMLHENFVFTTPHKMDSLIKESNCTASMNAEVIGIFKDLRGKVNIDFIKNEYLKDKDITVSPRLVNIKSFSEFFKSRVEIDENQKTFNETLIGRESLYWDHENTIAFKCQSCEKNGRKQLAIKIINYIENTENTVWAKFDLLERTKVIFSKKHNIKSFRPITTADLAEEYRYVKNPEHYFDNIEALKYYKSNKTLKSGQPIKVSDVSKRALIKPGAYVNVLLDAGGIKIKRKAKSMSYGYYGDTIKLMTPKRKEIFGVASNDNEVTVQL